MNSFLELIDLNCGGGGDQLKVGKRRLSKLLVYDLGRILQVYILQV